MKTMKDGERDPSWPAGFVWSDEDERPVWKPAPVYTGPQRGDVEVDKDGTRWLFVAHGSRVREGSLAAEVIFG